jgi:hypothetical protein
MKARLFAFVCGVAVGLILAGAMFYPTVAALRFDEAWIRGAQHAGLTRRQLHGISIVASEEVHGFGR